VAEESDRKDVEPVLKMGPEFPLFNHPAKVVVGSRNQVYVYLMCMAAAEPLELLFLENAAGEWARFIAETICSRGGRSE
jgi:hypothetical protein